MRQWAYYNEIDPFAAQWLRELIKAGHIASGDVDERSIVDVVPADLAGYDQCHFFAGIGVWSYALRLAGWGDDRPVWTGSCPCQPLSGAGQRKGHADERHLWPAFHRLISECRPAVVLGEQVAGKDGREWFSAVRADLEADGYACGGADLCAAGVSAPHIRQRLYWVADAMRGGTGHRPGAGMGAEAAADGFDGHLPGQRLRAGVEGATGLLADAGSGIAQQSPWQGTRPDEADAGQPSGEPAGCCDVGGLADADEGQRRRLPELRGSECDREDAGRAQGDGEPEPCGDIRQRPDAADGFWRDADWLLCRDGKWRAVEPGTFPLVAGATARMGRLRGYGNAIVAPLAAAFIEAVMEAAG